MLFFLKTIHIPVILAAALAVGQPAQAQPLACRYD